MAEVQQQLPPKRQNSCATLRKRPSPAKPPPPHVLAPPLARLLSCLFKDADVPPGRNVGLVTSVYKGHGSCADTDPLQLQSQSCVYMLPLSTGPSLSSRRTASCALIAGPEFVLLFQCRIRFSLDSTSSASSRLLVSSFVCFLDPVAAYDRGSQPLPRDVLRRLGIHGAVLAAVQAMYSCATVAVRVRRRQGPELQSLTGVQQGYRLSPTLFGLLADGLHAFYGLWLKQMALLWRTML